MATCGFYNVEECPKFMDRETEVFSSYFTKLIYDFVDHNINIDKLMICLSGQHEMITDFSGFRNFFTLNFIAKPIYNAYLLSSRLFTNFLKYDGTDENTFILPTTDKNGKYSIMLTYCSKYFKEDIAERNETLILPDEVKGKKISVYCIDKETTNPYRLYQRNGYNEEMSEDEIKILRKEGLIKPIKEFVAESTEINLKLSANCVYLIAAE
jgi:beta-xylosidase